MMSPSSIPDPEVGGGDSALSADPLEPNTKNSLSNCGNPRKKKLAVGSVMSNDVVVEPLLFRHAVYSMWPDLIERTHSHPHEALYVNENGWTALRWAIQGNAPDDAMVALLAIPVRFSEQQENRVPNPLLTALLPNAEPRIVRRLLEANVALADPSFGGGRTPLEHSCVYFGSDQCSIDKAALYIAHEDDDRTICRVWQKTCLIVRAAYHGSVSEALPGGSKFRMLHGCAGLNSPSSILQIAMKVYPTQLTEVDECGNCPLHLAAGAAAGEENWRNIVSLVEVHPASAEIANETQPLLPLQVAIRNGKKWSQGVMEIFEAHPTALLAQGIDDRFYPDILAFLGRESTVSAVYEILLGKPLLIAGGP